MLQTVKSMLGDLTREDGESALDLRIAAAALLAHVATIDGHVAASEKRQLVDLLQTRFALDESQALRLIRKAVQRDRESADFDELTRLLVRRLSLEERRDIIAMMWTLARADGAIREFEESMIWRIAHLLGAFDREQFAMEALRDAS